MDFDIPVDHWVKLKESEKKDKYLDLARELKIYGTWRWQWYQLLLVHLEQSERTGKWTRRLGNQKTKEDHPDNSITKIDQNTEKSPGGLRRLAVTQTSGEKPSDNARVKTSRRCKIITQIYPC